MLPAISIYSLWFIRILRSIKGVRRAFNFPPRLGFDAIGGGPEIGGSSDEIQCVIVILVKRYCFLALPQSKSDPIGAEIEDMRRLDAFMVGSATHLEMKSCKFCCTVNILWSFSPVAGVAGWACPFTTFSAPAVAGFAVPLARLRDRVLTGSDLLLLVSGAAFCFP
jgi:hypothetical protein